MRLSKLLERLDKLFAEDELGDYEVRIIGEGELISDVKVNHKSKTITLVGESSDDTQDE